MRSSRAPRNDGTVVPGVPQEGRRGAARPGGTVQAYNRRGGAHGEKTRVTPRRRGREAVAKGGARNVFMHAKRNGAGGLTHRDALRRALQAGAQARRPGIPAFVVQPGDMGGGCTNRWDGSSPRVSRSSPRRSVAYGDGHRRAGAGTPPTIRVQGTLARLIDAPDLFPTCTLSGGAMVAEEGLEPPTRGL